MRRTTLLATLPLCSFLITSCVAPPVYEAERRAHAHTRAQLAATAEELRVKDFVLLEDEVRSHHRELASLRSDYESKKRAGVPDSMLKDLRDAMSEHSNALALDIEAREALKLRLVDVESLARGNRSHIDAMRESSRRLLRRIDPEHPALQEGANS